MATFDLNTFLALQGQGTGLFTSLGTAFGMPSCMLNLTNELLGILPSSVLQSIDQTANLSKEKANEIIAAGIKRLLRNTGIIEYDTETGLLKFGSDSSLFGSDSDEGGVLNGIGAFLGAAAGAVAVGSELYRNYQNISAQIDGILDCLKGYEKTLSFQGGLSAKRKQELNDLDPAAYNALVDAEYGRQIREINRAKGYINEVDRLRSDVANILLDRYRDPSKEPLFTSEWQNQVGDYFQVENPEDDQLQKDNVIIRLVFGPPKSTQGQFLLSVDGLYYDSQTASGIEPVLMALERRKSKLDESLTWKYEFDPNLGGRGEHITKDILGGYMNDIFNLDVVDMSTNIDKFYSKDGFLRDLIGQKQKRVGDLSGHIGDLQASGADDVIIQNFQQSLMSEIAKHDKKINKRRKQIEIAVKAPSIFNAKKVFRPGQIPVNDFSYLQGLNLAVDIEVQKKLVFNASEVSGIVLPVETKYVKGAVNPSNFGLDHLLIPEIGVGDIIYDTRVSAVAGGAETSVTDVVITDQLFAIYNYLEANLNSTSDTDNLGVWNSISTNGYNNAGLVGNSVSSIFDKGLAIPYLQGITKNYSSNITQPSAVGSFIRLPDTKEFKNLTYNRKGFTFETWVYAPNLTASSGWSVNSASGLHRIILACENTGSDSLAEVQSDLQDLKVNKGTDFTKGLLIGFTRDRRITYNLSGSNEVSANTGLSFYIAPTQSNGPSSVGFIRNYSDDTCSNASGWKCMKVDGSAVNSSGIYVSSCESEFCLISITSDYVNDEMKIYLDGQLLATSSIRSIFSTDELDPIRLPNLKKNNSFEYNLTSVGSSAPTSLKNGPKLNTYFTPWILGGGYTDGNVSGGNFMGDNHSGIISGLLGYLGSTKFYSKALTEEEVLYNYTRQNRIFKNIRI